MQRIALAWYLLQLTHGDSFAVGVLALAQFAPFSLFGLFAGVITDRRDARLLVIWTQVAQLVTAVVLTVIAVTHIGRPWMLYAISAVNGLILVLDVPSRQQLTYRMVGPAMLPNAIALNSSLFNASRIFGPSLAGIVLAFAGISACFVVNAVSFLAVLVGLLAMRPREFFPAEEFERPSIIRGTREGLVFVWRQPQMLLVLSLTLVLSLFCFNFQVTLPVLAYNTLQTNASVFGLLSAAFGAGALAGALAAAWLSTASLRTMLAGAWCFAGGQILLAPVKSELLAGLMLFVIGVGFTVWTANSNASIQLAAPFRLRGRIIGFYFFAFNGAGPLSGLLIGWLCSTGGTELAFFVSGIVGVAATAAAALRFRSMHVALGDNPSSIRRPGCPDVPMTQATS
jgi:MFS family permease